MSPTTTTRTARPGETDATRFRCTCGRSVVAPTGSEAAASGRCSRCRSRQRESVPLRRV